MVTHSPATARGMKILVSGPACPTKNIGQRQIELISPSTYKTRPWRQFHCAQRGVARCRYIEYTRPAILDIRAAAIIDNPLILAVNFALIIAGYLMYVICSLYSSAASVGLRRLQLGWFTAMSNDGEVGFSE